MVSMVDTKVDGRVARGQRTRRALAESMINLIESGDPDPTARAIAEGAGVSLRLVFHHFDDLESILRAAVEIQQERHWRHIRQVEPTLAMDERLARVVRQRTVVFEAIAPVRRSAERWAQSSPTVDRELTRGRKWLRRQLHATFAPELEGQPPAERRLLLDALEVATSWETWDQLQRLGRTTMACRRTMAALAGAVLSGPSTGGRL